MTAHRRLEVTEVGDVTVVRFVDRKILDELSITEIGDALCAMVDQHAPINLLLDFKQVHHLSSAALGMLITLNKKIGEKGGQLRLSDINPQIFEVFKITQLHKVFKIFDNAAMAKASFAQ